MKDFYSTTRFLFVAFFLIIVLGLFFPNLTYAKEVLEGKASIEHISRRDENYYSDELLFDFPATAIGFSWPKSLHTDAMSSLEVQFFQEGQWFEWTSVVPSLIPSRKNNGRRFSDLIFTDSAEKIILRSGDKEFLKNVEIIYINASTGADSDLPTQRVDGVFSIASTSNGLNIVSRKQWGADESYRFGIVEDEEARRELIGKGAEVRGDYIELWPHEYADVKKFVMHETAGSPGKSDPEAIVRGVYYYHAKSLGWGDCGYNYILDTFGNIYECKSGGDGVVAGHVYATETVSVADGKTVELGFNMNVGSIGISVLGNYATDTVTGATQNALAKLVEQKAIDFQIDPEGFGDWEVPIVNRNGADEKDFKEAILSSGKLYKTKGIDYGFNVSDMDNPKIILKNFLNFVGHKDIDYKSDPQKNLEQVFTNARKIASQSYNKRMKDGISLAASVVSQSGTEIKLNQNQSTKFWVKIRNDGEAAWHNYTDKKVVLSGQGGSYTFDSPNVKPGETALITFTLAPDPKRAKETHVYELSMVGVKDFEKKKIEVTVINLDLALADYAAEFQGHNFPPAFFDSARPTLVLTYRNVGKKTWKKGDLIVNVVENLQEVRPSPWRDESWTDKFGKFTFTQGEVAPEETATFTIPFANLRPGTFNHRFYITRLVERDGVMLGEEKVVGSEAEVQTRVDPIFGAELVLENIPPAILSTWNVPVEFTFKNTGLSPWKGTLKLVNLYKPEDVAVSFIDYGWVSADVIAKHYVFLDHGEETTFTFNIDAPRAPGMYEFQYKLMVDKQEIYIGTAIEQTILVRVD